MELTKREFLCKAAAFAAVPPFASLAGCASVCPLIDSDSFARSVERMDELIDNWDAATELVEPKDYSLYMRDGDTRGFMVLDVLERAFEKVLREARDTVVTGDVPAVWSVYNMGYIVKTRESLFSIDLVHRRDVEFAPLLDFALVTHNHVDHWRQGFVNAVASRGKPVVSNFIPQRAGYTRAKKVFKFNDVEIRTSLIDHNEWLIDFTTAFEIKVGDFILYHTGDSGRGTVPKLETVWGRPDLWLFFPGCSINVQEAVAKVDAKRIVFGHLWELGHKTGHKGRLDKRLIHPRLAEATAAGCKDVSVAFWGDRIV